MTFKPVALLLADLGVVKTHSRPHVSNDNPFSEGDAGSVTSVVGQQSRWTSQAPGRPAARRAPERLACRSRFVGGKGSPVKPGRARHRPVAEYLIRVGTKHFRATFSGALSEDDLERIANVPFSGSPNPTIEEARHHIEATLGALNLTTVGRLGRVRQVLRSPW
jgi:hypothetical protein